MVLDIGLVPKSLNHVSIILGRPSLTTLRLLHQLLEWSPPISFGNMTMEQNIFNLRENEMVQEVCQLEVETRKTLEYSAT